MASQDVENRAFCTRQGWAVSATVTDNDMSASAWAVRARPGFDDARKRITAGEIDVLVCWEASRAYRDLAVYVQLREMCADNGVLWAYSGRVYDLNRTDDRFTTGLDVLLAEREASQTRDRIRRGIRTAAAEGKPHGTIPFGYRRERDPRTGGTVGQVPDPETAPVVREIVRRVQHGEALHAIAADLTTRNILTPQQYKARQRGLDIAGKEGWTSSKLRRLLSTQSIIGVRTHKGVPHADQTWKPIVSPSAYAEVQQILADPTRRVHDRGLAPRHLLSGIAVCGVCGAWCRAGRNRGRPSYVCAGFGPGTGKGHVTRTQPETDLLVAQTVLGFFARPDVAAALARTDDGAAAEAALEAANLQARLDGFIASAADGGVSPSALAEVEARLRPQIEVARQRAVQVSAPASVAALTIDDAQGVWESYSMEQRRQVVRFLMRVTIQPSVSGHGVRGFDPSRIDVHWRVGPGAHR